MTLRALALLGALALLARPSPAGGQGARLGTLAEPGGTVVGRVCLDLDGDGACGAGEPGISGARVRFEDGRVATADAEGRFHAFEVGTRAVLADRSAYGAHAVSADGLGVARRYELAARGAASVDLPVPLAPDGAGASSVDAMAGPPRLDGERLLWPIGGTAPPGARVRAAGDEVEVGADGRWVLAIALSDGANAVAVVIEAPDGGLVLWGLGVRVVRPTSGPLRVYPTPPSQLATLIVRPAGDGAVVLGRAATGGTLRIGAMPVHPAADGRFGAFAAGEEIRIEAEGGGVKAVAALRRSTSDRPFQGILLGELELQAGGDAGFLVSGRLAGSVNGAWRGLRLSGGVDLDDRDGSGSDLASPRDALELRRALDPQRTFPTPGDSAALEDANPGGGRLWARAEGRGMALTLGSARAALAEGGLGRWDRALFGGRFSGEATVGPAKLGAVVVGGRASGDAGGLVAGLPGQDVLAATGGSLFYLSHRQLATGSEIVRVQWRDPFSGLPIATRELTRGLDYDLDVVGGRLLLRRPISTMAPGGALVPGEPLATAQAWLLVDYLRVEVADGQRGAAGAELRGAVGPVSLSFGGATETRPGPDWELLRGRASVDLGPLLRGSVEVARSDGQLFEPGPAGRATSLDGGFSFAPWGAGGAAPARAFHAGLAGEAGPARWQAWWRERPGGYSDGEYGEALSLRERGAVAQGALGPVELRGGWAERQGADPRDPTGTAPRDAARAFASAAFDAGALEWTIEGLHERLTLPERGAQSAAGVRAGWRASRGLVLEASHLQAFAERGDVLSATFSAAGARLRTAEGTLALRAGWGPELGPRVIASGERGGERETVYGSVSAVPGRADGLDGAASAVGGRQRVKGGSLFTEDRVARDPDGLVAGRLVGASLEPVEGLTVTLSGERGERQRLDGSTAARGAGSVGAAWVRGALRLDGRGELRSEGKGDQWLAGGGARWAAAPRLTLEARLVVTDGELGGRTARGADGWLSAAWRADAFSVLGRVGRVVDDRKGIVDRDATIAALALTLRPVRRASLALGLDAAHQRVSGVADDRLAGSVRGAVDVVGPVDLAVEYARRGSLEGRELGDLDAVRVEAGLASGEVRLALGYTVAGFRGTGIDPEERDGRFYLRAVLVH